MDLFNLFDTLQVSIFEVGIIFCSDKLYHNFSHLTFVSQVVDPNTMRNTIPLYCGSSSPVDCFSLFFGLVFEVIMDNNKKL